MNRLTWLAKLYGCIGFAACAAAVFFMFTAAGWLWIISAGAVAFAAFAIGIWIDNEDMARTKRKQE